MIVVTVYMYRDRGHGTTCQITLYSMRDPSLSEYAMHYDHIPVSRGVAAPEFGSVGGSDAEEAAVALALGEGTSLGAIKLDDSQLAKYPLKNARHGALDGTWCPGRYDASSKTAVRLRDRDDS